MNSDQPVEPVSPSRRSVLRGAGVGAVGLAAATGVGFFGAGAASAATRPASAKAADAKPATVADVEHSDEPVVVYVSSTKSGELEIMHGSKQVTIRNQQLVNELLHGLKTAQ